MFSESAFRDFHRPWGPAVTNLLMHLLVTGTAERHQVALIVRPASGKRNDVVNFFDRDIAPMLQTFLTEGMFLNIPRANCSPSAAIAFGNVIAACEFLVVLLHQRLVDFAVLFAILTEISTARPSAWSFWLHRHRSTSLCITKAPEALTPSRLHSISLATIPYHIWHPDISGHFRRIYIIVGFSGTFTWDNALLCHLRIVRSSAESSSPIRIHL